MRKVNVFLMFATLVLCMQSICWAAAGNVMLIKSIKTDINKQAHSTIKITYPVAKKGPHSEKINAAIHQVIDGIITNFKKNLADNGSPSPMTGLPLTVDSNALDVTYKVFQNTPDLLSLRFSIYTNFYGAAHPLTVYQSLNYDVKQDKVLALDDVFQGNDYLTFLSDYSKKVLTAHLTKAASTPTEPDAQGLKPTADNFQIWNMTAKGLLITFPPYQVAAYVFGPQEVAIPYADLKDKLKLQSH